MSNLQQDIDYIVQPKDKALREAEAIAADERYTAAHKQQQIRDVLNEAIREIEDRAAAELKQLEDGRIEAAKQARQPFAPSVEDAPRLLYVRDALLARAPDLSLAELVQIWRDAIELKDKATVRAFMDYYPTLTRRKVHSTARGKSVEVSAHIPDLKELIDASVDLFDTPEQRRARQTLKEYDDHRLKLLMAKSGATSELKSLRLSGTKLKQHSHAEQMFRG